MAMLKSGTRLRSATGGVELIVTRGGEGTISCSGSPMVAAGGEDRGTALPSAHTDQPLVVLGKRYRTADGAVEVLCVRQGVGALELDGAPMDLLTQPKPLPASD